MLKGKTIAIVAPASISDAKTTQRALAHIQDRYRCRVLWGEDLFHRPEPKARATLFLQYALDDSIDVILALRGGEGSADIIPFLNQSRDALKAAKPKLICGMSDITALLFYFHQLGWPVCHSPVATQFAAEPAPGTLESLDAVLTGHAVEVPLTPLNGQAKSITSLTAPIMGGNLTLLNISIGDCWEADFTGHIVFIEDWQEKGYAVNRTLKYLKRIGQFKAIKGLILGDFKAGTICTDPKRNAEQIAYLDHCVTQFAAQCPFPVFQTDWIGHGKQNKAIQFGSCHLSREKLSILCPST